MNNQFSTYQLGEVADIIAGGDKPKIFNLQRASSVHVPVFANAEKNNGLLGYTDTPRIVEPAVTVSARGSNVGFVAIRKEPFFPIVRLLSLIPNRGRLDVDYLFYNLKQNRKKGTGSGQPQITIPNISSKTISLPPISVQKKVSKVLATLDKKIELNNQVNAQLETMAKTLYDYWFVQFDFPDKNGRPYKSSGGKMVYNETLKHEIPEGWSVDALSCLIKSDKTGDWGKDEKQGNYTLEVSCIRGTDVNGVNGLGLANNPTRFILEKNSHKLLDPYDVVIEISGGSPTQSTGRLAFITESTVSRFKNPLICSNFCKAISLKENVYFYNFVYLWNLIYENNILFCWEGKTSGIKNLLFDAFVNNYQFALPSKKLAQDFFDFVETLQTQKQVNLKENKNLVELRDWLLPMLMNGQVKVK